MLRAKAPLRISFAGGGTDIPFYYKECGGAVLASTIDRYTHITACPHYGDRVVTISSLDFDLSVKYHLEQEPIYDGTLDLVKAAARRLVPDDTMFGLDIYVQSDAPAGSGLGGSSALTIAVAGTLAKLFGRDLDRYELAELAYEIERVDLEIGGGRQDQYEIAFGGFNLIEFSSDAIVVNPLRVDAGIIRDLEYHLMLCYTGVTRPSAGIVDQQEKFYREGRRESIEGLRNLHKLSYEMKNALLKGRLYDFAEMLNEEWRNKVLANPQVTTELIEEMYAVALANGVIGGKLLGAGAGGYLLLFTQINKKRQLRETLEKIGGQFMPFSFVDEGLVTWRSGCP